jgi:microcompartment protein CcmK/EutM
MRIGKVIGNVTLNNQHETFNGSSLKLVIPFTYAELCAKRDPQGDSLVLWDDLNASVGSIVCFSEGGEAVQPFKPHVKPVDAYLAAILDDLHLDSNVINQLNNQ